MAHVVWAVGKWMTSTQSLGTMSASEIHYKDVHLNLPLPSAPREEEEEEKDDDDEEEKEKQEQ